MVTHGMKEDFKGPNRRVSFAVFEIKRGKAIVRSTYASTSTGHFSRHEEREFEDMTRAGMPVTRSFVCIMLTTMQLASHMQSLEKSLHIWCTSSLLTRRWLLEVMQTSWRIKRLDSCWMLLTVSQLVNSGLTDWNTHWTLTWRKNLKTHKDMNVRQFHSISYLDLKYLRETIAGKADPDPDVGRKNRSYWWLLYAYFLWKCFVYLNWLFLRRQQYTEPRVQLQCQRTFFLTKDILMLRGKDADSHSPILVTIEPSDMTNQEKKAFLTDNARKQRAKSRKELQKARKAKWQAKTSLEVYFSTEKDFKKNNIKLNVFQKNTIARAAHLYQMILNMEFVLNDVYVENQDYILIGKKGSIKIHPYVSEIKAQKKLYLEYCKTFHLWMNENKEAKIELPKNELENLIKNGKIKEKDKNGTSN